MSDDIRAALAEVQNSLSSMRAENRLILKYLTELVNSSTISISNSMLLTTTKFGRPMILDGRDMGSGLEIALTGKIEPANMRVLQRSLMPGVTFLDIGANFGFYTIMAGAQLGSRGKIFAFEPNPSLIPYIERSAEINGLSYQLVIFNKAVSDYSGEAAFGFALGESGGGSLARGVLAKNAQDEQRASGDQYLSVPVVRIDDVLPPETIVDVVKIDVEGNEGSVIRGMRETISRSPNIQILMEFSPVLLRNNRGAEDLLNELDSLGLSYWRVDDYGNLQQASIASLLDGPSCDILAARTKPEDRSLVLPPAALIFPKAPDTDGYYTGHVGDVVVHGPYWFLQRGVYDISVSGKISGSFTIFLTHEFGSIIGSGSLTADSQSFKVRVEDDLRFFEVVIRCAEDASRLLLNAIVIRDA